MKARGALLVVLVVLVSGCAKSPELDLEIQLPVDKSRLAAVARLDLTATRNDVVIAHGSFSASAGTVSLEGVSHGADTVFTLDGVAATGAVIAKGASCAVDFEGAGTKAPLYFAPTNFFGPTSGAPVAVRTQPAAMALDDGTALLAGGADPSGAALASSELFTPGLTTFAENVITTTTGQTPKPVVMNVARTRAEATPLASIGLLVTGGLGADGQTALASGEIYLESDGQFLTTAPTLTAARVDHRAVLLSDGRAFLSGGGTTATSAPLSTTEFVDVESDGTFQVTAGPPLVEARRAHAAAVTVGVPFVFGGYGAAGTPLDSIEVIDPGTGGVAKTVGHLATARADATATPLADGSILIVGGVGAGGAVLASAEIYNPVLPDKTTTTTLFVARHGHTATLLADGRVLIAGGLDATGAATTSVEIFGDGDFVTERSLTTARAGHVAVPLCDGTVLMVGGGDGAELYTGAAD